MRMQSYINNMKYVHNNKKIRINNGYRFSHICIKPTINKNFRKSTTSREPYICNKNRVPLYKSAI